MFKDYHVYYVYFYLFVLYLFIYKQLILLWLIMSCLCHACSENSSNVTGQVTKTLRD